MNKKIYPKTLLDLCHEHGIDQAKTVREMTGLSHQTLSNWVRNRPEVLRYLLLGIAAELKEGDKPV